KIKCVSTAVSFNLGDKKSPEELLKQNVRETLEKSEGVDGWADLVAALRDDGKMSFTATAYFKDVEQLKLHVMGISSNSSELVFRKEAGGISVEMVADKKDAKPPTPPEKMTEEEIKARMKEERAKYQQSKPMME